MTEIRFYHLLRQTLNEALPVLLEKCLARDWRAIVLSPAEERVQALDQHLWLYNEKGFLPHGTHADGHAADQPVWLTNVDENPNAAQVMFLIDGATTSNTALFDLVCIVFDGNDPDAVANAREQWKTHRDQDLHMSYWQQEAQGGWKKNLENLPNTA